MDGGTVGQIRLFPWRPFPSFSFEILKLWLNVQRRGEVKSSHTLTNSFFQHCSSQAIQKFLGRQLDTLPCGPKENYGVELWGCHFEEWLNLFTITLICKVRVPKWTLDRPIWPLFKGKWTQKMRGIVLPPFTFISERQRIFITFLCLLTSIIICSMTNVLSLRIMCGGYSFHLHFTILPFFVWF